MKKTIQLQTHPLKVKNSISYPRKDRDAETQTCAAFRKAIPVRFVPKPCGTDSTTEIGSGDLFHFPTEVEPILEVLIARTLDVSHREVVEETDLARIRLQQQAFERRRQAEIIEAQRHEAEEIRKDSEKQRRVQQEKARMELQKIALKKAIAQKVAKDALQSMPDNILKHLRQKRVFEDPEYIELETVYVPSIVNEALTEGVRKHKQFEALADSMLSWNPPVYSTKNQGIIFNYLGKVAANADAYNQLRRKCVNIEEIRNALVIEIGAIISSVSVSTANITVEPAAATLAAPTNQ